MSTMISLGKKALVGSLLSAGLLYAAPYGLDKGHSSVEFKVKHLMISNVTGSFSDFNGAFDFDEKTKTFTKLEGTVNVTSIDTGIGKRDDHLRSEDFFWAEKHPTMTFVMKEYKASGDTGKMTGDLTIRGVTKTVTMDTEINGVLPKDRQGKMRVGFTLEGKINRQDFGLKWNSLVEGVSAVGDEVTMTIEGQGVRQ